MKGLYDLFLISSRSLFIILWATFELGVIFFERLTIERVLFVVALLRE
jgi:hypothetical protein